MWRERPLGSLFVDAQERRGSLNPGKRRNAHAASDPRTRASRARIVQGHDMSSSEKSVVALSELLHRRRIPALDFLRAVAILLVVGSHSGLPTDGGMGVEIFFVLSGFLITWLLLQEYERSNDVNLRAFYRRRVARLAPAMVLYVFGGAALEHLLHRPLPWYAIIGALTYTLNYVQAALGAPTHYLSHLWSLAVEEQFYLIWPLMFVLLCKRRKSLIRYLLLIWLVIDVNKLFYAFVVHATDAYFYRALETRADELAAGCVLATVMAKSNASELLDRIKARPVIIALIAVVLWLFYRNLSNPIVDKYVINYSIAPILIAILIPMLILEAGADTFLSKILRWRVMILVGEVSYGLYLCHELVMLPIINYFQRAFHLGLLYSLGPALIVAVGVSWASFQFFETPLRAWLQGKGRRFAQQPIQAANL